jgi:hypothetical protein
MGQHQFEFEATPSYSIFAQPEKSGFFGLTRLQAFAANALDPYIGARVDAPLILDFSLIKVWDVAALLWLVIALHHYRQAGLPFLLRLPEGDPSKHTEDEVDAFDRSADYLRRWGFQNALLNLSPEPATLLVPEQRNFFETGQPRRFYLERAETREFGLLQSLISRRLVHIRNLAEPIRLGPSVISDVRITECIAAFQSARMGDILNAQCGIPKRDADLFADHLLTEALLNMREHPKASIGMIAISLMGRSNELVLAVADNGESIPSTIFPAFSRSAGSDMDGVQYERSALTAERLAAITNYATHPGVTSKPASQAQESGMGLTYIKNDTVEKFHGKLRIVTEGVLVRYEGPTAENWDHDEWKHPWTGNLLRIAIPLNRPVQLASNQGEAGATAPS